MPLGIWAADIQNGDRMLTGHTPKLRGEALIAVVAILFVALTVAAHAQDEGRKPDSEAKVTALIRQLQGSDTGRREQALDALLKKEPMTPAAIAVVAQAMKNPDDTVRQYVVQVLAQAGPDAIRALALAIDDQNQQVRVLALDALGQMARPR